MMGSTEYEYYPTYDVLPSANSCKRTSKRVTQVAQWMLFPLTNGPLRVDPGHCADIRRICG